MVGPEEVDELLENEVKVECSKFGPVDKVVIFQEKLPTETIVKVFVAFVHFTGSFFDF